MQTRRRLYVAASAPEGAASELAQYRQQLFLGPPNEFLLVVATDLDERDLAESGFDERLDLLDVLVDAGTAGQGVGDLLGRDELCGCLE